MLCTHQVAVGASTQACIGRFLSKHSMRSTVCQPAHNVALCLRQRAERVERYLLADAVRQCPAAFACRRAPRGRAFAPETGSRSPSTRDSRALWRQLAKLVLDNRSVQLNRAAVSRTRAASLQGRLQNKQFGTTTTIQQLQMIEQLSTSINDAIACPLMLGWLVQSAARKAGTSCRHIAHPGAPAVHKSAPR